MTRHGCSAALHATNEQATNSITILSTTREESLCSVGYVRRFRSRHFLSIVIHIIFLLRFIIMLVI